MACLYGPLQSYLNDSPVKSQKLLGRKSSDELSSMVQYHVSKVTYY